MLTKEQIIQITGENGELRSKDITERFSVSRQYVNSLISELVSSGKLVKIGSTRKAFYTTPEYAKSHEEIFPLRYIKSFKNKGVEEHRVFSKILESFLALKSLPENIQSIFAFAFSEMLNNAIEHSKSPRINLEVSVQNGMLSFVVEDSGVGVFRNVMRERNLRSEMEAVQDILKGKTTTMPKSHSGEGIFFTSKAGDIFTLNSFGDELTIDNRTPEAAISFQKVNKIKRGTRVSFQISVNSDRHLNQVFKKYTNIGDGSDYGFDKTEIRVNLYAVGGILISRSQARRILSGLEKFNIILFDFDKVPTVGQAFADEVFRVFHNSYPNIKLETENMSEGVKFMVERAKNEAKK
jgi:anti-sigma regulatory factor (Ser/Thr protein kinase)